MESTYLGFISILSLASCLCFFPEIKRTRVLQQEYLIAQIAAEVTSQAAPPRWLQPPNPLALNLLKFLWGWNFPCSLSPPRGKHLPLKESTQPILLSANGYQKVCFSPSTKKRSPAVRWLSGFDHSPDVNGFEEQIKFEGNDLAGLGTPILPNFVRKLICSIGFLARILI